MSMLEKKVSSDFDGKKIRVFLREDMGLSSRLIRGASIDKRIFVNDVPVKMDHKIHINDIIKVDVNKKETQNIEPEKMDLDIVHEDDDIIVINKRPYTIVHPTRSHTTGTLANGLIYYFRESGQDCIVRLVSRLDRDTSGLIIIGKNQYAHMKLSNDMADNNVSKRYIAIVHGELADEEGTIDLPIYRPEIEGTLKRVVDERGQRSITHYKVLDKVNGYSVVECLLETGRTHQIRVHLSHLGCPIVGDTLYGKEGDSDIIPRQALHAYGLDFKSPRTEKELSLRAELPDDIKKLIEKKDVASEN